MKSKTKSKKPTRFSGRSLKKEVENVWTKNKYKILIGSFFFILVLGVLGYFLKRRAKIMGKKGTNAILDEASSYFVEDKGKINIVDKHLVKIIDGVIGHTSSSAQNELKKIGAILGGMPGEKIEQSLVGLGYASEISKNMAEILKATNEEKFYERLQQNSETIKGLFKDIGASLGRGISEHVPTGKIFSKVVGKTGEQEKLAGIASYSNWSSISKTDQQIFLNSGLLDETYDFVMTIKNGQDGILNYASDDDVKKSKEKYSILMKRSQENKDNGKPYFDMAYIVDNSNTDYLRLITKTYNPEKQLSIKIQRSLSKKLVLV